MPIRQYTYWNEVSAPKQKCDRATTAVITICHTCKNTCHRYYKATNEKDTMYHHQIFQPFVRFTFCLNETVINPPAELGRLTDAGGGEQSIKIENSAV